jgi:hypothetical protein
MLLVAGALRVGFELAALGEEQRWIGIRERTELLIQPDKVLLGADDGAAPFAQLQLMRMCLYCACAVHGGEVPLGGQSYSVICRTDVMAIAAEDACVVSKSEYPNSRFGCEVLNLSERFGRAGINARAASNTAFKIEFRFAPILAGHHARFGGESSREPRRKYSSNRFSQFSQLWQTQCMTPVSFPLRTDRRIPLSRPLIRLFIALFAILVDNALLP